MFKLLGFFLNPLHLHGVLNKEQVRLRLIGQEARDEEMKAAAAQELTELASISLRLDPLL